MATTHPVEPHVLIIGAGITGLLLAQSLRKEGIAFSVHERDPTPTHRGTGWGLALHWALDTFLSLVPQELQGRLPETYVDPLAVSCGNNGRFPFFNLSTGEERYENLSPKRVRLSREKLRRLLMGGLDIQWGKNLERIEHSLDNVTAFFSDGTSATATHLVGCDGTRSQVRKALCTPLGTQWQNEPLPGRFLGASAIFSAEQAYAMRELDPLFMQGSDPKTNVFLFFAFQDTPANNDRANKDTYSCQVIVSWPYRAGFLGRDEPTEIPTETGERLKLMRQIADGWASPFREAVLDVADGTNVQAIRLEDWPPALGTWTNLDGRATLIGDAAHAMTMYRGEAANHGITDVRRWLDFHLPFLRQQQKGSVGADSYKTACDAYEREMVERTRLAVFASRKACLDAHDYPSINDRSPLVSKRAIVAEFSV